MGNVIDGEAKARKIEQTEGGKGGPEVTTERFILTSAIRICEGPIAGVLKIWRNDQLVYDRTADDAFPDWEGVTPEQIAAYIASLRAKTSVANERFAIYLGTEDQLPDPTLEAIHGVGNTPYYRGTAYIVVKDDDVTDMRGAAAQWKFEVLQAGTDEAITVEVPNLAPRPGFSISGGLLPDSLVEGSANIMESSGHGGIDIPPVVKVRALRVESDTGDSPIRVRAYLVPGGTALFDSGWMGNPAYGVGLSSALAAAGRPDLAGPISPVDIFERILDFPGRISDLVVELYRAGITVGPTSSAVGVQLDMPEPALLPAEVTTTVELPHIILGGDGILYVPEFVDDNIVDALVPGDVTLSSVFLDVAERCDVPASRIDVSSLSGMIIPGLLVSQQNTGADCIRPMQQGFFFDTPEYDKKIRAINRGAATVVDITDDDLLDMDQDDARQRPQEVEYPRLVSVLTQDPDANYAPVPQTSMRTSLEVNATSEVQLPLAIPFRANESKRIAEKLHKVLWSQAEGRIELPLPEEFSRLVPSDCFNYSGRRWLVEQTEYADGVMRVRAAYDRASAYTSNATGQPAPPPVLPSTGLSGQSLFEFLNLPILSDLDDRLGFYVAVSVTGSGWRGATVQASIDGGASWANLVTTTARSVIGRLVTELPNAPWDVLDTRNTVRVQVFGELSSITFEQLLNEGNPCVIGDEICQFQTATFVSDGVYDLSILSRGRLNTDTAAHAAGERFVLLNAPVFVERPSSWIGRMISFRSVPTGTSSEGAPVVDAAWSPAWSQTEWPPVAFIGSRDSSNNIAISWVGQGRLGSNKDAHNSQFFDAYRVTLTKGAASVTYTTTAQSFAYSAALQTSDFGSATGTLDVSIAAVNRITGAGEALTGSVP